MHAPSMPMISSRVRAPVMVKQGQRREARSGHEARVGWAEDSSRKLLVTMFVAVGDSFTNLIF